jgi:hypothetical protein
VPEQLGLCQSTQLAGRQQMHDCCSRSSRAELHCSLPCTCLLAGPGRVSCRRLLISPVPSLDTLSEFMKDKEISAQERAIFKKVCDRGQHLTGLRVSHHAHARAPTQAVRSQ